MFKLNFKAKRNYNKMYYTVLVAEVEGGKYISKITLYSVNQPKQIDSNTIEVDGARMVFEEPVRIY